jgi:stress-induced morphogen
MADTASTSGITADSLKDKLVKQLEAQHVEIEDMSGTVFQGIGTRNRLDYARKKLWLTTLAFTSPGGCGQAFQAIIVSPQFEKKNMLARHRLVNSVLKEEIAAIHAWTPKCYTPEQWEKLTEERA